MYFSLYMKRDQKKERKHEDEHYAAEEQGILPKETREERLDEIKRAEREEDPSTEEGREQLVEDDEIEPWEAGFAQGASEEGQLAKDALTGEPLMGSADVYEEEIDGKMYRFVSEENAQKFREKKEKEEDE
jgi:YHS domain-containing protein